jgi:hypothetical protein
MQTTHPTHPMPSTLPSNAFAPRRRETGWDRSPRDLGSVELFLNSPHVIMHAVNARLAAARPMPMRCKP